MRTLSTLLLSLLLCATCLAQPDSRPGPFALTKAKWQAVLTGTKTAGYIVDGSGACRLLVAGDIPTHNIAAGNITSGTLPLARLSGITTTELSASAGITSGQIAGLAIDKLSAGTLGTTLELGTQLVTSTGDTSWYNATAKNIQLGINSIPSLSIGSAWGGQADIAWCIGRYGAGATDNTAAGIGSNSASHIYHNVMSTGLHHFLCGGSERLRVGPSMVEADRLSLGGSFGSSADPSSGGLALTNRILFSGAGTASGVLTQIWSDASAGNLFANVPTGKYIESRVAGSGMLVLGKAYGSQGNEFWGIGPHPAQNAGTKSGIGSNGAGVLINAATGGLVDICSGNAFILRCATTGITITDGINLGSSGSVTGNKLGTAPTQKWSFWGATPVIQPALTGTSTTLTTAGSTNALYADSTSTGGIGSTAYSLPDVVRNLKTAGLLAP